MTQENPTNLPALGERYTGDGSEIPVFESTKQERDSISRVMDYMTETYHISKRPEVYICALYTTGPDNIVTAGAYIAQENRIYVGYYHAINIFPHAKNIPRWAALSYIVAHEMVHAIQEEEGRAVDDPTGIDTILDPDQHYAKPNEHEAMRIADEVVAHLFGMKFLIGEVIA